MVDVTTNDAVDFGTVMTDEEFTAAIEAEKTPEPEATPTPEPALEDNSLAPEDTEDDEKVEIPVDEQEESPNLKLKPKKKSAQERIDEVTAARRAAEREVEDLRRQLAERSQPKEEPKVVPVAPVSGPSPDDLNEAGEAKYPLGDFDPDFIRDLARHTVQQEQAAWKSQQEAERRTLEEKAAFESVNKEWQDRLSVAKANLPDIEEKGVRLESVFNRLEPEYGQYVAQTIMTLDNGPEVLYYLSDNLEEAADLFGAGPLKATLGLGELNSMFKKKAEAPVKVSSAPEPPEDRIRGNGGKFETPDDTDDLAAFSKKFYGR